MYRMKFVFLFLICGIAIACNTNSASQANTDQGMTAADSTQMSEDSFSDYPIYINSENYYDNIQKGEYHPYSLNQQFVKLTDKKVDIQVLEDTALLNDSHYMHLIYNEPIALFDKMYPKDKQDVAGVLTESSLIYVDTVFYNNIYINSDKAPMSMQRWYELLENGELGTKPPLLTYDVWYAIRINGKRYYTDSKVHNYIEYVKYIPSKEQMLVICSQGTGYDGGYDNGYPDFYRIVVFQEPQSKGEGWKQIYCSPNLDLNGGGSEEFGIADHLLINDDNKAVFFDTNKSLVLELENCWRLIWNGKDLSVDWDKNYLNRDN